MSKDPLLQPYTLKHLTLKNRIMTTSHEPAYPEDGMPKDRYRAYHEERAKAGVAMTMTAGSAAVSRNSPPVFNNILAYKDEVVPWMAKVADACHEHGCAVMIQLTHLGRRTHWNKGDWLPAVSPSHEREAAHRAFPKKLEEWDIARIIEDYADAAERMKAAGLDGIELQAYGHLMDQFWSERTNTLDAPYGGSLDNRLRFTFEVLDAVRSRVGEEFIVGVRYTADEDAEGGITPAEGIEISKRLADSGQVDFLNVIRGHIDTDPGLTDVIPVQGMKSAPHLDFAGEVRKATGMPTFHAARIPDVATARHAIAAGKLDMVGMTRAHMADPHVVRKDHRGARGRHPPLRRRDVLPRPDLSGGRRALHPQRRDRARAEHAARHPQGGDRPQGGGGRRGAGGAGGRAGGRRARPQGDGVRGGAGPRRPDPADGAEPASAGDDRDHRLAHGAMRGAGRGVPLQHLRRGRRRDRAGARSGDRRDGRAAAYGRAVRGE